MTAPASIPARRSTPPSARGGLAIWLMALGLLVCLAMIAGLLLLVGVRGVATFWPRQVDRVLMAEPESESDQHAYPSSFLAVRMAEESYDPGEAERSTIERLRDAGAIPDGALDEDGRPIRRYYWTGNRDVASRAYGDSVPQSFRWVSLYRVRSVELPAGALMLERKDWGAWLGWLEGIEVPVEHERVEVGVTLRTPHGPGQVRSWDEDGGFAIVRVPVANAEGEAVLDGMLRDARSRLARIERLESGDRAHLSHSLDRWTTRLTQAELSHGRWRRGEDRGLPVAVWLALLLGGGAAVGVGAVLWRRGGSARRGPLGGRALVVLGLGLLLASHLERPFSNGSVDERRIEQLRERARASIDALTAEAETIDQQLAALRREDGRYRLVVRDDAGLIAPEEQSLPDVPMRVSQVVRVVRPNDLGWWGRLGVYLSRWWEFLSSEPRGSNTEGGVLPVIIGTVTLTLLLTVVVVPLGVVAAIYLREYARQGPLVSLVRIAINNLAGVPSIVYGVFGLGFFAYTVGKYVDAGSPMPMARPAWWLLMAVAIVAGAVAMLLGGLVALRRREGAGTPRRMRLAVGFFWLVCAGLAVAAVWTTPYFHGWFEARNSIGTATFGTKGLLWAALTLALLTLPVVIVATEEAIAAVPRSLREGSYGCGASKWQTIRRIVLPGAMPGILTGAVLAIARGAGEVAPLMLVGVGKVTSGLPISSEFPYLHANRGFMHLGFHIYDVGFQSTDSEAARPLVWTTTLLLVTIVLALNSAAIVLRARLRGRHTAAL